MVWISVKICFHGQTKYQWNAENNFNDMPLFGAVAYVDVPTMDRLLINSVNRKIEMTNVKLFALVISIFCSEKYLLDKICRMYKKLTKKYIYKKTKIWYTYIEKAFGLTKW